MINVLFKRVVSSLILIPVVFYVIYIGSYLFNIFLLICFFLSIYEFNKFKINNINLIFGFILLIFSFYTAFTLRNLYDNQKMCLFIFFFITLVCISTDIGGYVFGKLLKGPKLTKISPNKTISGSIGSFIMTMVILYFYINLFKYNSSFFKDFDIKLATIIFFISLVNQIGDLFFSYLKRISNLKDTGNIIPGHGGILDRIDGAIFAFPFAFFLIKLGIL